MIEKVKVAEHQIWSNLTRAEKDLITAEANLPKLFIIGNKDELCRTGRLTAAATLYD